MGTDVLHSTLVARDLSLSFFLLFDVVARHFVLRRDLVVVSMSGEPADVQRARRMSEEPAARCHPVAATLSPRCRPVAARCRPVAAPLPPRAAVVLQGARGVWGRRNNIPPPEECSMFYTYFRKYVFFN